MTNIQTWSTEKLKEFTENAWKQFCIMKGDDIIPIKPRTYVKEDFAKGSTFYQIFEEYESRIK